MQIDYTRGITAELFVTPSPDVAELVEAARGAERRLTQATGIIVEFGDLNGFRNASDEELGRAVLAMATAGCHTLDRLHAALSAFSPPAQAEGEG